MRIKISTLLRRAASGVAMAAVLLAGTLAMTSAPAAAHAKLSPSAACVGSEVGHHHTHNGAISIFVSYSSANNGTNCVWAQKQTSRGTGELMTLRLRTYSPVWDPATASNYGVKSVDHGVYRYYAGPISAFGTAGECIMVDLHYRGSFQELGPFHCG